MGGLDVDGLVDLESHFGEDLFQVLLQEAEHIVPVFLRVIQNYIEGNDLFFKVYSEELSPQDSLVLQN